MAVGDKLVTLDGLKAVYQDVNGNIVDLKSAINDVAQINIYTLLNSVPGKIINASGEESSASNGLYTGIITVRKGEKYNVSFDYNSGASWTVRIHGYNSSGAWVEQLTSATCSSTGGKSENDIEIPNDSTIAGIRVSFFRYDLVSNPKIVQYIDDYSDITAIDYVARNKCETINTELNNRTGVDTPSITYKSDSAYIKDNGDIASNSSYFYSTAIAVEKGDVVDYYGKGYNQNVAMISVCDSSTGNIDPKVVSEDSTVRHYRYTVQQDGYITISGAKSADYTLTIFGVESGIALLEANKTKQDYIYASFSMFRTFGVIGDSYASGYIDLTPDTGDTHVDYNLSWGQVLARMAGNNCYNFSQGGLSTETWLTDSQGKAKLEAESPLQLYIICLGINDYWYATYDIGNSSDIGTNNESFYGYYSKIISIIQNHAPNAKIICSTMRSGRTGGSASFTADEVNQAIENIAQICGVPCIKPDNDPLFTSEFYLTKKSQGHPVAVMYSAMAKAYRNLIERSMLDNLTYFYDYVDDDE